jgi:hypothetical protein
MLNKNIIIFVIFLILCIIYCSNINNIYYFDNNIKLEKIIMPKYSSKKIAIIITGQIREGFEQCLTSIKMFIISPLKADVFCVFENTNDKYKEIVQNILEPININYIDTVIPSTNNIRSTILSMFHKIQLAGTLIENHERKTGIIYDNIIRIRPDIYVKDFISPVEIDKAIGNNICMPVTSDGQITKNGVSDMIAIGSRYSMEKYMNTFTFLMNLNTNNICDIAECLLRKSLNHHNIVVTSFFYPYNIYRIRFTLKNIPFIIYDRLVLIKYYYFMYNCNK